MSRSAVSPCWSGQTLVGSNCGILIAFSIVVLIALALRLWHLGSIPTVFFHDECDNTVNAIEILQGKGPGLFGLDWKPQPALAVHQIALSLKLMGPSVTAIRMPSAMLSVLALIPFFFVARRMAGSVAALLAALLLACNVGYVHFSRTGWENVQICLYTLVAMEAVSRGMESNKSRESWLWSIAAGFAAALGAYIYFAGRAIIAVLVVYSLFMLWRAPNQRRSIARGLAAMLVVFLFALAPMYPTLRTNWGRFNQRTRAVLITSEVPPGGGVLPVVRKAVANGARSGQTFFRGVVGPEEGHRARYFPTGRPWLDWLASGFLVIGAVASLVRLRVTLLWWLALLVPFTLTQMATTDAPNLARGIGMLPITYLFVALGMHTIEAVLPEWRRVIQVALLVSVMFVASISVRDYFRWAGSDRLAGPLQPAVQLADFTEWWELQNTIIQRNQGFFNVNQWLALRGTSEK